MQRFHLASIALALSCSVPVAAAEPAGPAQAAKAVRSIVGHRGSSADRPENTLASYRRALEAGANIVEIDVRTTKDGVLVSMHDADVRRTTNGKGLIHELTLAELQQLDAGGWFDAKYQGERVPMVREILGLCQGKAKVLLDLKEEGAEYAARVIAEVRKHGSPKEIVVGVRSVEQARLFRKQLPEAKQIGLIPRASDIDAFAEAGVETIRLWPHWLNDTALVPRVRKHKLQLHLGTKQGTKEEVLGLLPFGPESLSSDDPARLIQSLAEIATEGATRISAPAPKPELAPDQELLAKIAALPDNTWLKLPPCRTTGDMGVLGKDYQSSGPRVRDYCNRMVWAPERQRALYCGGGHNVHPWNDVWEFDLAANTWVCLYGADPVPPRFGPDKEAEALAWYKANAVVKDGVIRTPRGGPLRPCHTWWSLCYDSERKRMLFVESHKGLFATDKAMLAKAHNLDPMDPILRTYGSGAGEAWLLSFYPETGEWKEVLTGMPKAGESSCLEHLPDQKTLWWLSGKTYRYETAKNEWRPMPQDGPRLGGESAYDPETKKVVVTVGLQTWVFSCATNTWTLAQENAPDGGYVPVSVFCFDSTAKKFVLCTLLKLKDKPDAGMRLWLYDVKENQWTAPAPPGDGPKLSRIAGYYDPARNVTVLYSNQETWVYRGKKAAK